MRRDGKGVSLAKMEIKDEPANEFRSVMLDVARRWHPMDTIKDTVELLRLYKIGYLHLHLSDNQSMTFTSKALSKLATPNRSYSAKEMGELVRYAQERGVVIIPEIDIPGHSGSWVGKYPELFGTTDPTTGKSRSTGIVNMASEKAYKALDTLVAELCDTFKSSPYIHLGADEVGAAGLVNLPEYLPYVKAHGLKDAQAGKSRELFCHFVVRMSDIVKKHGRTMIVWNGFPSEGTANVKVPKEDMLIMSWAGSPLNLIKQGYRLINCCWLPLYIVPPQGRAPLPEWIYGWNTHQSSWWGNDKPVEIPADAKILGAQICFWEQRYNEVMPALRPRVPALSERLWSPDAGKAFEDLRERAGNVDRALTRIIRPVTMEVQGLIDPNGVAFENQVTVRLKSDAPGTIRYKLSKPWEEFPAVDSPAYDKPIVLSETMTVSARLFDASGHPIGGVTQERFSRITPAYKFRVMGPSPQPIWRELPNFSKLKVLQAGVTGLMTADRGEQINRSMFAGLSPRGHIDVRVHGLWNPYAIELTGQIKIPVDGEYTFKVRSKDGQSALQIGERPVCEARRSGEEFLAKGTLKAGTYPIRIQHYWRRIFNDLNIQFQGPGMAEFEPLEKIVLSMAQWARPSELKALPAGFVFANPGTRANGNQPASR